MLPPRVLSKPCPCRALEDDTPLTYGECCAPWHEGAAAPTPEALMRSRYSAYTMLLDKAPVGTLMHDHLVRTWHPSNAPGELTPSMIRWMGLEVLDELVQGNSGVVEFVAHHKINGKAGKMHEVSRFVREAGAWLYIDGQPGAGRS
jgi:SEC-C motif domain protein